MSSVDVAYLITVDEKISASDENPPGDVAESQRSSSHSMFYKTWTLPQVDVERDCS